MLRTLCLNPKRVLDTRRTVRLRWATHGGVEKGHRLQVEGADSRSPQQSRSWLCDTPGTPTRYPDHRPSIHARDQMCTMLPSWVLRVVTLHQCIASDSQETLHDMNP
jgi:hypothetical protein